jgi:hypothetical protein
MPRGASWTAPTRRSGTIDRLVAQDASQNSDVLRLMTIPAWMSRQATMVPVIGDWDGL